MMRPPWKWYKEAKSQYPHLPEAQVEEIAWANYRRWLTAVQQARPTQTFLGWDRHGNPLPTPTGDPHGRLLANAWRRLRRTVDIKPGSTPPRRFRVNVPLSNVPYAIQLTTPMAAQEKVQAPRASVAADIVFSDKAWDIIRANEPAVDAGITRQPTPFVKKLVGEYKKKNQISANQVVVDIWRALIPASETKGAQKALQNYMRMMQAIRDNPETPLYFFDTESSPIGGRQIISEITFGRYRFEGGRFVKAEDATTLLIGMTEEEAQAARAWIEDLRKSGRRVTGEESAALDRFIKYAGAVLDENGNIIRYGESGLVPDFDLALRGIERLTLGSKKALPGLLDPKAAARQVARLTRSINERGGFFVATNSYAFDEPNLRAWAERFGTKLPEFQNSVDLLALLRTTIPDPAQTLHGNRPLKHGPLAMDAFRETLSSVPGFNVEGLAHSAGADVELLAEVFNFVHQQTNLHQNILDANRPKNPISALFSFDDRVLKPGDMLVGVEGMFAGEHDLVFDLETGEQVDWFREGALATRTHYELKGVYYDDKVKQYRAFLHNLEDNLLHVISAPDQATLADRFHQSFEWVRPNRVRQLSMLRSHQEDRARRFYLRMHSELKPQQFDRLAHLYSQFGKLTTHDVRLIQKQLWDERLSTGQTVQEFLADAWKYTYNGKTYAPSRQSMVYLTYLAKRLRGEARYFNEAINKIRSSLPDERQNFERMQALAMFYRRLNEQYPLRSQRKLMFFERHQVEIDGRMVNLGSKRRIANAVRNIIRANAPDTSPLYETMRENAFYSLVERLQEPIYGLGEEKVALLDANEALNIIGNRDAREPLAYKVNRLVNTLYGKRDQFTARTIEAEGINRVHRVRMSEVQQMADEAISFIQHRKRNYRTKSGFRRDTHGHLQAASFDYGPLNEYLNRMEAEGIHARSALDEMISVITGYKGAESEARVYLFEHGEGRFGIGLAFFDRSKRNIVEGILPTDDLADRLSTIGADYFNLGVIDINEHTWTFKNMRRTMRSHYVPTDNLVDLVAKAVAENRLEDFTDPRKLMGMVRREDSFQYVLRRARMIRDSYIQARRQYGWGSREARARMMDALGRVFNELSDTTSQRGSLTMADRQARYMHQFEDLANLMRLHDEAVRMVQTSGEVDAQRLAELARRFQEERDPYIAPADQARYMKVFQEVFQDDEAVKHLRRYVTDEFGNKAADNQYLYGFVSETQAARWMLTSRNPRDTVPTSETDPNARAHIEQMKRTLPLDPSAQPGPESYMRKGSLWMTESGWQAHREAGYNDSRLMKVAIVDDDAVIRRLRPELYEGREDEIARRALDDARRRVRHLEAEGLTVEDVLPFISTHEQHMGVRESTAQGLAAKFVRDEVIHLSQGEELTGILLRHFNPQTGEFTPFAVNEDVEVSRFTGVDRREHRGLVLTAGTRVVGARMDGGDLVLSIEEDREFRMGGKGLLGGDKGTMHRWRDRVFDIIYGDWDEEQQRYIARFDVTANFNVAKHQDYSMVLRGMVDDALDNVNRLMEQGKISREEARQKVEEIADRLAETIGWRRESIQVVSEDFDGLWRIVTPDRLPKLENGRGGYRIRDVRALRRWLSREGLLTRSEIGDVLALEGGPGRQSDTLRSRVTWEDEGGARFGRRELEALDNWGNMQRTIAAIKEQMQEETLRGRIAARAYADSLVSMVGGAVEREAPVVNINDLRPIRAERLDATSLYNTIVNPVVDGKELLSEQIRQLDELDNQLRRGLITLEQREAAATAMPGGYWLEFDDLIVDGQNVIPQKRIFIPITETLSYPGNKQLTEVQHALRQLHRSYYDLLTMYGHHPNEPTPMVRNRPLTRDEALENFHQAFRNLREKLSWELSAKEGQAAKNLSVRMLNSGRGQVGMLSPALTAQFDLQDGTPVIPQALVKALREREGPRAQEIIAGLNRQIKEAAELAGGMPFREGDIYMTEGRLLSIVGDDAEGRALADVIRRGEDVYGLNIRYPTFHDEALAIGRIRLLSPDQMARLGIESNDPRFFATPGTIARLRGDTDGDEISMWIARNAEIQAEWREAFASERYQYALYRAGLDARDKYAKMGNRSFRNRIFTTFNSLIRQGQEYITEAAGLSDSPIEERLQKKYVGIISNLGFDLRESTKAVFGYDSDIYKAVAYITDVFEQKGISAKHNRSDRPMGEVLLDALAGGERAEQAWREMLDETGENVLKISREQWNLFQKARDNFAERNIAFRIFREKGLTEDELLGIIMGTDRNAIGLPRVQQVLEQLGRYGALENLKSPKVAAAETSLRRHGISLTVARAGQAKEQQRREAAQAAVQSMAGSRSPIDRIVPEVPDRPTANLRASVFRGESKESFFEMAGRNLSRIGGGGGGLMGIAALAAIGFAASVVSSPRTRAPLLPENTISLSDAPPPEPPSSYPSDQRSMYLEQNEPEGYELRIRGQSKGGEPVAQMVSQTLSDTGHSGSIHITERDDTTTLTNEWVRNMVAGLLGK